jgi:nucleotide-binding universal stress UspA family protein
MLEIRRIVVPTDFSDAADRALGYAAELAQKLGAEIHVIHAWQLSAYASPSSELAKGMSKDLTRDLEAAVKKRETAAVKIHRHLRMGVPYVEIVQAAKELDADLIVMGTTGKTGLEHFLLGSVAERIVRTAECPVLTVRHHAG